MSCRTVLVFDAVRIRVMEIGEAVKDLSTNLLVREPTIPWEDICGDAGPARAPVPRHAHAIVQATVTHDVPVLEAAVQRLRSLAGDAEPN